MYLHGMPFTTSCRILPPLKMEWYHRHLRMYLAFHWTLLFQPHQLATQCLVYNIYYVWSSSYHVMTQLDVMQEPAPLLQQIMHMKSQSHRMLQTSSEDKYVHPDDLLHPKASLTCHTFSKSLRMDLPCQRRPRPCGARKSRRVET